MQCTLLKKANPAVRHAVKTMGRLAKEKSRTAYREVRSKIKDSMHSNRDAGEKPRSAPSSPKFGNHAKMASAAPSGLTRQLSSSVIDRSLRRCETSVSQHYAATASLNGSASSEDSAGTAGSDDDLNMAPLNLNLMDDFKDLLAQSTVMGPPLVDRSVSF